MRLRWCVVVVFGALFGCASATPVPITEQLTTVEWLPLLGPPGQRRVDVLVLLDGRPMRAILDSGAMTSAIPLSLATRFGHSAEEKPSASPTAAPRRRSRVRDLVSPKWRGGRYLVG